MSDRITPAITLAGVELADAVSQRLIARAAPLGFNVVQSSSEREAIYRLRYQVAREHGWGSFSDEPDGLVRDEYDDDALHVAGWDTRLLIAASRLVFPHEGRMLPTEEIFGVEVEPRGQVVDWSRLIVARSYSNLEQRVFAALLAKSWLEMRARGFSMLCGNLSEGMIRLYKRMGLNVYVLGPARGYWGEARFPARVEPPLQATPQWLKRWFFGKDRTD